MTKWDATIREAYRDAYKWSADTNIGVDTGQRAIARAVELATIEECALKCDAHAQLMLDRDCDWNADGAKSCAAAIRALAEESLSNKVE